MSKHFYEVYIYLAVAQKCYFHSHIGLKNMASAHYQKPNNLLYPAIMWFWVLIKGSNKVHCSLVMDIIKLIWHL